MRRFTIVEAGESLAQRQQFTDQIGLITLAFYAEGEAKGVGTAPGEKVNVELSEHAANVGKLHAVVHIRYVEGE